MPGHMALDVIGREDELGSIRRFSAVSRTAPVRSSSPASRGSARRSSGRRGRARQRGFAASSRAAASRPRRRSPSPGLSDLLGDASSRSGAVARRRHGDARSRSPFCSSSRARTPRRARDRARSARRAHDSGRSKALVLVALDDLQWLDQSSGVVLQIALRRLRDKPCRLTRDASAERRASRCRPSSSARFPRNGSRARAAAAERRCAPPAAPGALELELTRPELARVQEATRGTRSSRSSSGVSSFAPVTRPSPGQRCACLRAFASCSATVSRGSRQRSVDVLLQVAALARPTVELVAAALRRSRARARGARGGGRRRRRCSSKTPRIRFVHPLARFHLL